MARLTNEEFIAALERCKKGRDFCCLGCLLQSVGGLRGGEPEEYKRTGTDYYMTGAKGAHFYSPRSFRWITRVLNASLRAAKQQSPKRTENAG